VQANSRGTTVTAVVIMRLCSELANYGVDKVLNFKRAIKTFHKAMPM
jgi:hypothetical protein